MNSVLTASNIYKTFKEDKKHVLALEAINLKVSKCEFLILLGPSGSGKSTLLRILSGLIPPTRGDIIKAPNLSQAFIFQDFALFPWLTVYDNIAFGLKMHGQTLTQIHKAVSEEIEFIGLRGFEHSFPRDLSGGMKQRVGIARALVMKPQILFLDEPFSALDSFTAAKLRDDLLTIWQQRNLSVVMVTHLIEEALELGDRVVVLSPRPGQIEEVLANPLPRPRNKRSPKFFELVDKIHGLIKV